MSIVRCFRGLFAAVVLVALVAESAIGAHVQTTGHSDIRYLYEGGSASLAFYLDEGAVVDGREISVDNPMGGTPIVVNSSTKIVFHPSELITFVPEPPTIIPDGFGDYFAFTGANVGDPLWHISFDGFDQLESPWTGISTESVSQNDFSNISYQLTAFGGPGQMSLLQYGVFGDALVEIVTSDGLSSADAIDVPAGTHSHYEWLFTAPGEYTFELTGIGTRTPTAGGGTVSVAETFTFQVAVPEPSTAAFLAITAPAALIVRRTESVANSES